MANQDSSNDNTSQPDADDKRSRRSDGTLEPTPAKGQAAIVADPRNRPSKDSNSLQDGKKPDGLNASNDD
jgi:hypothetical protein